MKASELPASVRKNTELPASVRQKHFLNIDWINAMILGDPKI